MFTKFTTILTAAALALGTAAPVRADNDVAKIIGGLVVGGLIGAAIANDSNKNRNRGDHVSRGHRDGYSGDHRKARGYRRDQRVNLPGACRVYNGNRSGYSGRCLRGYDYGHAALPSACAVRVGGHHRTIYRDRCLNQYGYY